MATRVHCLFIKTVFVRTVSLCLFCLLASTTIRAETTNTDSTTRQAYIIELQNQDPAAMVNTLKPLLADGDGISVFDNELIITTTAQRIESVRQLVQKLDKPRHNLLITVKNTRNESSDERDDGLSGGITQKKVYVGTGRPVDNNDGVTISSDGLAYSMNNRSQSTTSRSEQHIRAVEGSPAFIYTGQSMYIPAQDEDGNLVGNELNANRGFYVTARLAGERVILDISVSNDNFAETTGTGTTTINTDSLLTTVSGKTGEWITLGGINGSEDSSDDSTVNKTTTRRANLGGILVRITTVD